MKAAVLHANRDLRYEDYPTPAIRPGAVKVRVRASGICGSDIPRVLQGGAHFYPIVLGHEFAGDIVEVGDGVKGLAPGDTVSGAPLIPCLQCGDCQRGDYSLCGQYSFIGSREQGSFAQYVVIPAANAVRYDASIPYIHAALLEPATVALHGLFLNRFQGGGDVAILGGGTIGLFALQWATILGARRTVVFDIDDGRLALAKQLGACAVINTRAEDFLETALALTGGRGFGDLLETAGSPATMRMAFELAAGRARICFIGTPQTELTFAPRQWEWMNRREFRLTGSWMSYSAPFPGREWELAAHHLATGQLRMDDGLIHKVFPLANAADAFALFDKPADVHGKVMLVNED